MLNPRASVDPRLDRGSAPTLLNWRQPQGPVGQNLPPDVAIQCGWGRLIFGHTFASNEALARALMEEKPGQRDIALYLRDPHVVLSLAPQELFLDPSHTYRLWLDRYRVSTRRPRGFLLRRLTSEADISEMNRIYGARSMVPVDAEHVWSQRNWRGVSYVVAEEVDTGRVVGTVTGVDHVQAFGDPEGGSSLWCLAVDPQATHPGIGKALVRYLAEHFLARGRAFMDLSVLHDNRQAIALYEKLGFQRVPVFCLKRKNNINEPPFIAPQPLEALLNPYAGIIVKEARRRGIAVEVLDAQEGYFSLTFGGRSVVCRESLSELTSAISMSRCDDKRVTLKLLAQAGLRVPEQQRAGAPHEDEAFLRKHSRLVVKPARGEQGRGISVDVRSTEELEQAVASARAVDNDVVLEQCVEGTDLRILVINDEVLAAAVRLHTGVTGDGRHTVRQLIEKLSRRREAATDGESRVPLDAETKRCVRSEGHTLEEVLPEGRVLQVRKTANLHTGGTLHDVTAQLHPTLAEASVAAARALQIPVVGLDFLVPEVEGEEYVIIEANERPGLANHEPQPTAERFVDLLFPRTAAR
ncbi:MAG TPA: N-acetylglutaminylglutamine synthetase [Myxococcaceae bacterium]|nr:N-acetylglutaminylglutamine synthetase [Myxococcaceae bacterium]